VCGGLFCKKHGKPFSCDRCLQLVPEAARPGLEVLFQEAKSKMRTLNIVVLLFCVGMFGGIAAAIALDNQTLIIVTFFVALIGLLAFAVPYQRGVIGPIMLRIRTAVLTSLGKNV
jgi:hypothetical protein